MRRYTQFGALVLLAQVLNVNAVNPMTVTVANDSGVARPAETISVPWKEISQRLPGVLPNRILVKDSSGAVLPCQLINLRPEEHQDNYESILFQHDFAAGERMATFSLEKADKPLPPFPVRASARYVPERFDDFAWENDRIAHRIYGPTLATPAVGGNQLVSSGVDVWCKRVRYPIIDRWYLMGHYHEDTGEGLDLYEVGKSRGCGGTGVWDGQQLFVSRNWASWKVLANGPVRAVFELSYEPWDAGAGVKVSERKRFTLDAGHNLNEVESVFDVTPAREITVGVGLAKRGKGVTGAMPVKSEKDGTLTLWATTTKDGQLGTAIVLPVGALSGFAEDKLNQLVLTKAQSGHPVRYYIGAGWDRSGDFPDQASWEKYIADFAARLPSPVRVICSAGQ
jgi:hypothetical protein